MQVLVVGSGGREHALAWAARQSDLVDHVYVAPGNAGTSLEPHTTNIAIGAEDIQSLLEFAIKNRIDLTIVGPEVPLTLGITDQFVECGLRCFGPDANAAQLEGSKDFTKRFLKRHGIPSAEFRTFNDISAACQYIDHIGAPIVVKADGLAAGKGVIVAESADVAKKAATDMLINLRFGAAGEKVVIEDFLTGEETSYICIVDGEDILPLASSQDHKAVFDGDTGPNTGGMGAYSPAPIVDPEMEQRILDEIIQPTVKGLMKEGIRYTGFLYAGLIIDDRGNPQVLEFNCRLGDPETQPLMFRLRSDLIDLIVAAVDNKLATVRASWDDRAALGVVLSAKGYPGNYSKGNRITGTDAVESTDVKVFHAGTAFDSDGNLIADGGRILCVTALAPTVKQAQLRAYEMISQISMDDMHFRRDIGNKALAYTMED